MRGSKWLVGILCLGAAGILEAMVPAVASLEYFYAKDGTVTGRCVNGKMQTYSYDKKGQLIAVVDFATHEVVEQYVYDPTGNILSKTINGKTTSYKYDKANQLVSSTCDGKTTNYEYDAAGRLVKEGTKNYNYGYLDKVLSVYEDGEDIASFTYHMDGQIATAKTKGGTESFLWDDLALISRNETEYVNEPYVTGGNPLLANDKVLFNDMLGTTLCIKDGNNVTQNNLTAFGEPLNASLMQDSFFTGKPYVGEMGYVFLYRAYRAEQGKWQTADPLGYPDGWNNFAYCNNTISFDRLGLLVTATFSITKQRLTIRDITTGKSYTVSAFSGNSNPTDQWDANVGPLPIGTYAIIENWRDTWWELWYNDGAWNDVATGPNGVVRGQFRLHSGTQSLGCITMTPGTITNNIIAMLQTTVTTLLQEAGGTLKKFYGTLRVVE